jgi:hypothetical protein
VLELLRTPADPWPHPERTPSRTGLRARSAARAPSQAGMRKFWTVIGLFASATPVGILLGVALSRVANSDGAAAVSALASGAVVGLRPGGGQLMAMRNGGV